MAAYSVERYEVRGFRGPHLVAERRTDGRHVKMDVPGSPARASANECRAFAAWLLVQAGDMDAEAAARKAKDEGDVPLD